MAVPTAALLPVSTLLPSWPPAAGGLTASPVVAQVIAKAGSPFFDAWWTRLSGVGYCARPVHLSGRDGTGRRITVMGRCKNRRAAVCPSCSDLYAGDTWHLVSAGISGAPNPNMPATVAEHPMVFATLTAPSYGAVHTVRRGAVGAARRCHPRTIGQRCPHGQPLWCTRIHDDEDPVVGHAVCVDCYDYRAHVLFSWHAPQLWQRFTIALRRLLARHLRELGADPGSVRIAHVKVVEMQARGIAHFHTVIRLDDATAPATHPPVAPTAPITTTELGALIVRAARMVKLVVPVGDDEAATVQFGEQIDVQPITAADPTSPPGEEPRACSARKVAGYLAKYVTKSVTDFGLGHHRLSPLAICTLDVTEHVRRILAAIADLAAHPGRAEMLTRLHTLGYRGHITTKTRRYSTTMGALRARRHAWRETIGGAEEPVQSDPDDADTSDNEYGEQIDWTFLSCGHDTEGERLLAITAAIRAREQRYAARDDLSDQRSRDPAS